MILVCVFVRYTRLNDLFYFYLFYSHFAATQKTMRDFARRE